MNSDEYQVTIKSANQKVDDYVTKCRPGWTVLELKQHISETHVNRHNVEDQRLIYAGNLLKDTQTLKQIFFRDSLCTELTNSNKADFTIHLVCYTHPQRVVTNNKAIASSQQIATSSSGSTPPQLRSASESPSTSSSVPSGGGTNRATSSSITSSNTATRPSNQQQQQSSIDTSSPISTPLNNHLTSSPNGETTIPLNATQQSEMIRNLMQSDQMRQQMAIFQQLAYIVAAQIAINVANSRNDNQGLPTADNDQVNQFSSLISPLNGQASNVQSATSSNNNQLTTTQVLYTSNRQQAQFVPADAHDAGGAGVHQNENINNDNNANAPGVGGPAGAQFGFGAQIQAPAPVVEQPAPQVPDQEVAIVQHDVIDWVYYSIRAAVLMAALYIHASMFRLLFLVGLLAIAYFFNRRSARRMTPAGQEQQQPQPQELHAGAVPQLNAPEEAERRRRNREQPDNSHNVTNETDDRVLNEPAAPGRVPFLKLCYLVVTDFLASLVPE